MTHLGDLQPDEEGYQEPEELVCACCGDACDWVDDDGLCEDCEDVGSDRQEHGTY